MAAPIITKCYRFVSRTSSVSKLLSTNGSPSPIVNILFSSTAQDKPRTAFRTKEVDPRNHSLDHVGLYYTIPENEMVLFRKGLHPWLLRMMNTFNEPCLMVRKPALELMGYLRNVNLKHPVQRFVLYGHRGTGKTVAMHHAIQSCYKDGWIIVHVPWAGTWIRGWKKEIAPSTHKPGRYDLPTDAAEWLSHFSSQNHDRLKDLKTTSEYVWTKREKAEVGTSFEEIINFGLSRLKFSSDCVGVILKELRAQAESKGLKVLVAIDCVNAFYVSWNKLNTLRNMEKQRLAPGDISLIHNFKKMLSPTWTHGAVVTTVSLSVNDEGQNENYTPLYLLQKEGFEAMDPFIPILVPKYTEKEALSSLNYFVDRNWIQNEYGKSDEGKKEMMFVSDLNPFHLAKMCAQL